MTEPFRIDVDGETLADLKARLRRSRWPDGVTGQGGLPLADLREIVRYWLEEFDWPERQRDLNTLPHFRTLAGGLRLHHVHVRCRLARATPLLLLHGWPGSFLEFLPLVARLRSDFHLVIPSLPGYGFSDLPVTAGMSNARVAELLAELMAELGYQRFAVQGGDWGAGIATWLALKFPDRVMGIHLNYIPGSYAPFVDGAVSAEEEAFLQQRARWSAEAGAYGHVQSTRPLTLGYGLSDSPAGLAAWIVEKFREWADPGSTLVLSDVLTNVTLYWVTNTIASSMRLYLESSRTPLALQAGQQVPVPCGIARFPHEMPFPPRSWIERGYDVVRWTSMPAGGHFAALEQPDLLARDVAEFAGGLT